MDEQVLQGVQTAAAPPAPKPELKKQDTVFVWISLVLGFLTVRFGFFNTNGFFTSAAFLLTFVCSAVYVLRCGMRPTAPQWMLAGVMCVFCTVFSVTASQLLHILCFIFLIAFQFWWVQAVSIKAKFVTRFFAFDLLRTVIAQPFFDFGGAPRAMKVSLHGSEKAGAVRNALIGIIATIPLTVIVAVLLSMSDRGMENMLDHLTDLLTDNVLSTVFQIIFAVPVGFLIFAMFRSDAVQKLYPLPSDVYYHEHVQKLRVIPTAGVLAGVTPICVLYIMYIISQANYFLSAFAGKLPDNMIYSEYARRGFFELCIVAVINLAVIIFMLTFSKKRTGGSSAAITVYNTAVCFFTLFIISTAIAKMFMYIGEYGLTRLRLYTAWFMVLLAAVFIALMIRGFVPKFRTSYAVSAAFIVLFGILCFSRPDALIAEYNISNYEQGSLEALDIDMLCSLSDDAYVVMLEHYDTVSSVKWENGYDNIYSFDKKLRYRLMAYESDPMLRYNLSAQRVIELAGAVSDA